MFKRIQFCRCFLINFTSLVRWSMIYHIQLNRKSLYNYSKKQWTETDLQWLLRIKSSVCLCLMYQMYSNIDNERNDNHYFHSVSLKLPGSRTQKFIRKLQENLSTGYAMCTCWLFYNQIWQESIIYHHTANHDIYISCTWEPKYCFILIPIVLMVVNQVRCMRVHVWCIDLTHFIYAV